MTIPYILLSVFSVVVWGLFNGDWSALWYMPLAIGAGVGTQLFQPPVTLINTMNGMTQKYIAPNLVDAVGKPSPTYWMMTRRGRKVTGAPGFVWSVLSSEEQQGGAYYGAQVLDSSLSDSLQPAELLPRFYYQSIVIPTTDLDMNGGPQAILDLTRAKEETAMVSLLQKLFRALYGTAPQNTSIDIDNIPTALGAVGGSYANIPLDAGFWLCNGLAGPTNVGASLSFTNLQAGYGQATFGNEEPDTIITTQAGFNAYLGLMIGNQRFQTDEETTRAGFRNHLMYNSAVVLHDQFVPTGEVEIFTSKYINPIFLDTVNFRIRPFIMGTEQELLVSRIGVSFNLKFDSLRNHSRLTNVTNA